MVYRIQRIARDVRIALDQNNTSEQLLDTGDIDTLSLDEIIISKIEEAARRVEEAAPAYLLEEGHNFGDAVYWGEQEFGWVLLPDDFMRLIVFEMSDWERPVCTAISSNDPQYQKQRSRYKGIRGNPQRPVCAIVSRPEGKCLEFYSCKSDDATVSKAMYLPYPRIDHSGGIEISERCYEPVIYMAAALVCVTAGEMEKGKEFIELSNNLLQ